ncbi:class I SAM-dependent methyltransferase [Paenibacillus lutrae]|uniref:Methyltransferase domain-containing protein n=1 Tax=Paenibacillus lutrae TaxID=2078573 RepID=A0A7X3JZJ7_9BACL|nr:class I SAM-dependent methyltransferase [Paenibacillus lutrae]MVP00249.1 methyltransferase domain-containing protein [Paenibacillus lutrae]
MEKNRLQHIRKEEKEYHEQYYEEHELYEEDSWIEEPDERMLDYIAKLQTGRPLKALDLGCGNGRNSIPLARELKGDGGRVTCVDLLDKALDQLKDYSVEYRVEDVIRTEQADISVYEVRPGEYDFILAASSLEHVRSETDLDHLLVRLREGTRDGGINYINMNTGIEEYDLTTGEKRETLIELVLTKEQALQKLRGSYDGWEELHASHKPIEFEINRGEAPVMMKADCVSFAVRKPGAKKKQA